MIKTKGLTHLNIAVSDLRRSLDFYQKVFGMEVQFWSGDSMVFLNTPGSEDLITLQQAEEDGTVGQGGGFTHFGFSLVDAKDVDDAVEQVKAAGGKVLDVGDHAPGEPYIYLEDPDGYVIEL